MQLSQPPEHPRRLVVEAASAGGAVVLLGQSDVTHPVENALEAHPALGTRERSTGTRVNATPESDVGLGVGPVDPEVVWAIEALRVAIRGTVEEHDRRAGCDVDATDVGRLSRQTEVRLHRA